MDLDVIVGLAETLTIVGGIIFAIVQIRHSRRLRSRESALQLLHSFQTPEFHQAVTIVADLPEGLSKKEIEKRIGDKMTCIFVMFGTFESLGVLIHRREIDIKLVEDFFSGIIMLTGKKFMQYFNEIRAQCNRPTYYEWIQWMYEQIAKRELAEPPIPSYEEYKNWIA